VHVKAGGTIEKAAPVSMTISGSLAQWRTWTGLPFDLDGVVDVPGALVPVHCDTTHDHAVYVEPNVWIRHEVRPGSRPVGRSGTDPEAHPDQRPEDRPAGD